VGSAPTAINEVKHVNRVIRVGARLGYVVSQQHFMSVAPLGQCSYCGVSVGEKAMKKATVVTAVAISMSVTAPVYAQSVMDCTKGPSENYVKCLEAAVAALRTDLDKFKSDVGNKAFQGDVEQIRTEITALKGKFNELEGRIGEMERTTKTLTGPVRISVGDNCLRVTGDPAIVALGSGCSGQTSAFTLQFVKPR
jgi:hypothetical protein